MKAQMEFYSMNVPHFLPTEKSDYCYSLKWRCPTAVSNLRDTTIGFYTKESLLEMFAHSLFVPYGNGAADVLEARLMRDWDLRKDIDLLPLVLFWQRTKRLLKSIDSNRHNFDLLDRLCYLAMREIEIKLEDF